MSVARFGTDWSFSRDKLEMSPEELRGLGDHELTVLLHERVERLREQVAGLAVKVDALSAREGTWSAVWSAVRSAIPWLLTATAVWVAGRQAHLW